MSRKTQLPLKVTAEGFIGIDPFTSIFRVFNALVFWVFVSIGWWGVRMFVNAIPNDEFNDLLSQVWFVLGIGFLALALRRFVIAILAPRFEFYRLDKAFLHSRTGVLTRNHEIVPRNRIQHTAVSSKFFERVFGYATLRVFTAGTKFANVSIPYLREEEAERIKQELMSEEYQLYDEW
ncbi:MAG: PH domain-containing protein [Gammaproteobacteria bacterium]|nr:PH domain-containing protein [Gammaproteobacteria bacterium]